jgi:hypothetical protein
MREVRPKEQEGRRQRLSTEKPLVFSLLQAPPHPLLPSACPVALGVPEGGAGVGSVARNAMGPLEAPVSLRLANATCKQREARSLVCGRSSEHTCMREHKKALCRAIRTVTRLEHSAQSIEDHSTPLRYPHACVQLPQHHPLPPPALAR